MASLTLSNTGTSSSAAKTAMKVKMTFTYYSSTQIKISKIELCRTDGYDTTDGSGKMMLGSTTVISSNISFPKNSGWKAYTVDILTSYSGTFTFTSSVDNIKNAKFAFSTTNPGTTYKIAFAANGGTGAPAQGTRKLGSNYTFPSTVPKKTGYTFNKWLYGSSTINTALTTTTTEGTYNAGSTALASGSNNLAWLNSDCTYVACWKLTEPTWSFTTTKTTYVTSSAQTWVLPAATVSTDTSYTCTYGGSAPTGSPLSWNTSTRTVTLAAGTKAGTYNMTVVAIHSGAGGAATTSVAISWVVKDKSNPTVTVTLANPTIREGSTNLATATAANCTYYLGYSTTSSTSASTVTWLAANTALKSPSPVALGQKVYVWYKATGNTGYNDIAATYKGTAQSHTGIYYKVNGEWKEGIMYTKSNGTWVTGVPYKKSGGAWSQL